MINSAGEDPHFPYARFFLRGVAMAKPSHPQG